MVKAKQRPDGRWYGAVYLGKDIYGKKQYKHIYANTEKECNKKIVDFEYKKNKGVLEEIIKNDKLVTLEDYWNEWLNNKIDVSESTIREYKSVKKLYLKDIMSMDANKIDYKTIQYFYTDLYKKTNAKRVKKVGTLFNCFLRKMAVKRDCPIPRDILDGLELPSAEKYIPNTIREQDYEIIIKELLKEYNDIHSNIQYLYIMILIASGAGCRIGEVTTLTINDIDFDNNIIKINKHQVFYKGYGHIISHGTKNKKTREVPMLPAMRKELEIYVKKQKHLIKNLEEFGFKPEKILFLKSDNTKEYISSFDLLITNNKGNFIRENTAQRNWREFRKKLGFEDFRIHDFRRYCATLLMENNVPDKLAQLVLGHSGIQMTQYYQNANKETLQKYMENISIKTK